MNSLSLTIRTYVQSLRIFALWLSSLFFRAAVYLNLVFEILDFKSSTQLRLFIPYGTETFYENAKTRLALAMFGLVAQVSAQRPIVFENRKQKPT